MAILLHLEVLVQPCWGGFNSCCRVARHYADIWAPPSKSNIFFLIGAFSGGAIIGDGRLTAEAIPSEALVPKIGITYFRWRGVFVAPS